MNASQLAQLINREGWLTTELSLSFGVRVLDARTVFNRVDFLVTPEHGHGERWVSAERVKLDESGVAK